MTTTVDATGTPIESFKFTAAAFKDPMKELLSLPKLKVRER
jgi:hypothetical protein